MVGTIDSGMVIFYSAPLKRFTIPAPRIDPAVDLVRLVSGDTGKFILHSIETGAAGIVVEAFGRGNLPVRVHETVERAREAGLAVVVVSRTQEGRLELSEQLRRSGVIWGEDLDGLKAPVLLMLALGTTNDIATIGQWFRRAGGLK